jgi:hypothetical protein
VLPARAFLKIPLHLTERIGRYFDILLFCRIAEFAPDPVDKAVAATDSRAGKIESRDGAPFGRAVAIHAVPQAPEKIPVASERFCGGIGRELRA